MEVHVPLVHRWQGLCFTLGNIGKHFWSLICCSLCPVSPCKAKKKKDKSCLIDHETPLWKCRNEYFIWKQNLQSLHKKSPSLLNKPLRNSLSRSIFCFDGSVSCSSKTHTHQITNCPTFSTEWNTAWLSPSCTGVYFNPPKAAENIYNTSNLERFQINCASSLSFSMSLWNSAEPSCNISVFLGQVGMLQNDLILRQLQTDW